MRALAAEFYQRSTIDVAVELLGKNLIRRVDDNWLVGRIVETEAYLGVDDPAAHSYGGRRTARTETMFRPGGHAYVYFIYGMYHCLNAVTEIEGQPEAVLIRALEPIEGLEVMIKNRGTQKNLANGPGKLCQAFGIDKRLNGSSLIHSEFYIEDSGHSVSPTNITTTPRVGIGGIPWEAQVLPLRFLVKDNSHVSPSPLNRECF